MQMGQSLVGRNHYALVKNYNKKKSHVFYRLSSPNYYKIFDDIIFSHFAKHTIKKPNNQNTEGLRASDFFVWLLIAIYPYRFGQLVSIHNLQPLSTIPILRYLKNVKVPSVMFDTKTQLLFDVVYTVSSTTSVPLPLRTCEQISTVNLDTLDAALTQHTPSRIVGFDTYVQTDDLQTHMHILQAFVDWGITYTKQERRPLLIQITKTKIGKNMVKYSGLYKWFDLH